MLPSSQQAYSSLQDFSKNRRSTQDIQKEAEDKYNVGGISSRLSGLRTLVGNLESSVEQVDPDVTGRLSGGSATEGQRQSLVNRERAPILGSLSKQQGALNNAESQFGLSSSLASELARNIRSDDESSYQRLLDQYNASTAQDQAAEAKRQYDQNLALEKQKAATAAKAAAGPDIPAIMRQLGFDGSTQQAAPRPSLGSIFGGASGGTLPVTQAAPKSIAIQPSAPKKLVQGSAPTLQGTSRLLQSGGVRLQ